MIASTIDTPRLSMSPQTPRTPDAGRWWEFARRGAIHCGPHPFGHHIPNTFHVNESGFIRCGKQVLPFSLEIQQVITLRDRRMFREADQIALALRTRGVEMPEDAAIEDARRNKIPCDRWVFLYAIRGGGIVTAAVTLEEKRAMEDLSTPTEMIDYLGIMERKAG